MSFYQPIEQLLICRRETNRDRQIIQRSPPCGRQERARAQTSRIFLGDHHQLRRGQLLVNGIYPTHIRLRKSMMIREGYGGKPLRMLPQPPLQGLRMRNACT